jgi:hypothetical protein
VRLVYRGGGSSTEEKTHLQMGKLVYRGGTSLQRRRLVYRGLHSSIEGVPLFGTDSYQNRMLEEIPRSGSDSLPL